MILQTYLGASELDVRDVAPVPASDDAAVHVEFANPVL
jgi:hypothetical protein